MAPLEVPSGEIAVRGLPGTNTMGREGDGPGEFIRIYDVDYADGTFHVFSRGRVTTFDDTLGLISTKRVTLPGFSGLALDSSTSVIQGWQRAPEGPWPLFHRVDAEGLWSFGPTTPVLFPGNPIAVLFALARSRRGGFWAAALDRYQFTRWSTQGRIVETLQPASPGVHFEEISVTEGIDVGRRRPPSMVSAIQEDADGLLWVATWVAKEDWEPLASPDQPGRSVPLDRVVDTVVEVIDLDSGVVVASQRIPKFIAAFVEGGLTIARSVDTLGVTRLEVLRLTIQPRG